MSARRTVFWLAAVAIVVGGAVALTSCGGSTSSSGTSAAGPKIALLLPESKTARYETQDKPLFEAKVKELCPDCQILYSNANQDATQQQSQAEAALANGAKVLVLDPVDSASATTIVTKANQAKVPVIAYDRPSRMPTSPTSWDSTHGRSACFRARRCSPS
jgi:D-xylose transport system substrate-binding protein